MVVDVHVEVLCHLVVHSFHLGIHLWVVRHRQVLFDAENQADVVGEFACKLGAPIRHNLPGDPEEGKDLLFVDVCELWR